MCCESFLELTVEFQHVLSNFSELLQSSLVKISELCEMNIYDEFEHVFLQSLLPYLNHGQIVLNFAKTRNHPEDEVQCGKSTKTREKITRGC